MRLLIVEFRDWLNPRSGGAERVLRSYFSRLAARRGWRIDYLCSAFPGAAREESSDGLRLLRRGPEWAFNLAVLRAAHGELRGERYDLVVEGIDKLPFFLPVLGTGTPVACMIPHLLGETAREAAGAAAGTLIRAGEALLLPAYHRCTVITASESTRAELEKRGFSPDRLRVVPYGIDPLPRSEAEESWAETLGPFLLYVGRLRRYKGLATALHAFAEVRRAAPPLRLVVAGEGDDRPRLERLARELGIADGIDFLGHVPEARKAALLRHARLLLYPSRKEGWGLPVLEANLCGTPAVASDAPGLRDAVRDGETGLLVPPGDPRALARAVLDLWDDAPRRASLGDAARAWAGTFDWDTASERLGDILEEAARG